MVIDEAANIRGLIGDLEAKAFAMMKKEGLFIDIISQSLLFEEEVTEALLQNATRIISYAVSSPETAKKIGQILATITYDESQVHHTDRRERQRHAGYDYNGKAEYQDFIEETTHFLSGSDQERKAVQKLMRFKPRQRVVIQEGTIRLETVAFLEEPWVFESLGGEIVQEKVSQMMNRPEYHDPKIEIPKQKPRKRGNKGMRKSKKG